MRDISYLTQLSTNVIRVSYIDPQQDHTDCMAALLIAGIYVLVDLPSVEHDGTYDWNLDIYNSCTQIIDAVAGHNNVLGFFAGNSIVANVSESPGAAFVKAAVRDLKAYIHSKYSRNIPVGYEVNAADGYGVVSTYMACNNNGSAIDFLGISEFDLCLSNSTQDFSTIAGEYSNYPVPIFFADYGCREAPGSARLFQEVQTIYGNSMTNILSGGIVYEYFQDDGGNGSKPRSDGPNISC
jgi:1,3-beta-glucanosyltransferase GAS1